jgi:hypothetical protein
MRRNNVARQRNDESPKHRLYLNPRGGELVRCAAIGHEDLIRMLEAVDSFELCEAGPNKLPRAELARLTGPLSALSWTEADLVTEPIALKRSLARTLGDRLARLRLKTGRHLLAGSFLRHENDTERKVLLLVLTRSDVQSCDWQLTS